MILEAMEIFSSRMRAKERAKKGSIVAMKYDIQLEED